MSIASYQHLTFKFTTTMNGNEIPFLDTTVYRGRDNYISTRVYHKPTGNRLYLYYTSANPWKQKEYPVWIINQMQNMH